MVSDASLTYQILKETVKERAQYFLTAEGKLRRDADTKSLTSFVLQIPEASITQSQSNFFGVGKCQIQSSPCKKYLALYFTRADRVWMLDFLHHSLYKFDWTTGELKKVDRCAISFQEDALGQVQTLEAIEVKPDRKADLAATQAILSSIQGKHREGLEMARTQLPPESEKMAVVCEKIGRLARDMKAPRTALRALYKALGVNEKLLEPNSEPIARVHMELGNVHTDMGNYDDAMESFFKALDIRQNVYGNSHALVAETFYNMAYTLQKKGNLDQALDCAADALNIQKLVCGQNSKEVAASANLMGFIQARRGKLEDALKLLEEGYQIRKKMGDALKVSESLVNLGNVYREKSDYEPALECYNECLQIRKAEFGDKHEKVAGALIGIAGVKLDQEENVEARRNYEAALSIRKVCFGENDCRVADVVQKLGKIDFEQGEYDSALEKMTRVVEIREMNMTRDSDYVNSLYMIGNIYKLKNNEEEAKRFWAKAYETFLDLGLEDEQPKVGAVLKKLQGRRKKCCEKLAKDVAQKLCRKKVSVERTDSTAAICDRTSQQPAPRKWAKKMKKIVFTV